ncbi:MAG: RAMP superfamily CRISPR-associated protein, partial [Oscillospiraceae bacterium]|nr:RAMP superfamily CRISPR-associated protein [Oscillospiraceae bacterium]
RLILAIDCGDIRFGSKKNRGLGRLKAAKSDDGVLEVYKSEFTKETICKYLDFDWADMSEKWDLTADNAPKYIKRTISLKLSGGISVRTYSAKPNEPDYTHIKCNDQPIIPGSTWNGAIRHRAKEILLELGVCAKKTEALLDNIFGAKAGDLNAAASKIVFSESIITGGTDVPMTRNRINRFDGSTMDGALYSEISHFGGSCDLEIMLKDEESTKWAWGLMVLVIRDIQHGFLSVGGQTAVGRGLFADSEKNKIEGEAEYIMALNEQLKALGLEESEIAV